MGAGAQPPLHAWLPGIRRPVALVVGAEDAAFLEEARALAQQLPDARVRQVPGAGHACHLEQPEAFLEIAREWLADAEGRHRAPPATPHERSGAAGQAIPPAAPGPDPAGEAPRPRDATLRSAPLLFNPHRRNP
jgi:hypothetical protein